MNEYTEIGSLSFKEQIRRKRAYIRERLESNFPFSTTFYFMIIITLIGLGQIALQIVLIVRDAYNWEICNGIWGGLACLLVALLNLILSIKKQVFEFFFFCYNIFNVFKPTITRIGNIFGSCSRLH